MTATGHAIVGAAIATQITNPFLALPAAFFSHYLCDKLPHWDAMTEKNKSKKAILVQSAIDVFLSVALVWLIFISFLSFKNATLIYACALAAQLPDWLEVPYMVFKIKIPIIYNKYRIQERVHKIWFNSNLSAPWGIITQVVVCGATILLVALSK